MSAVDTTQPGEQWKQKVSAQTRFLACFRAGQGDRFTESPRHSDESSQKPSQCVPWKYREMLARTGVSVTPGKRNRNPLQKLTTGLQSSRTRYSAATID